MVLRHAHRQKKSHKYKIKVNVKNVCFGSDVSTEEKIERLNLMVPQESGTESSESVKKKMNGVSSTFAMTWCVFLR